MVSRDELTALVCAPCVSVAEYRAHLQGIAAREAADVWGDLDDWGRFRAACVWCGADPMPGAGLCAGCEAARVNAPLPGAT